MKTYRFCNKNIFRLAATLVASAIVLYSCSKEDTGEHVNPLSGKLLIKAGIDTSLAFTKTIHTYQGKTLKTSWAASDEIAVAGTSTSVYKFVQAGNIAPESKTTTFVSQADIEIPDGVIIAVYPYSENLQFVISTQSGNIEDLKNTDILLAKSNITKDAETSLNFSPICALFRFPEGMEIASESTNGQIEITITGENVSDRLSISKDGGISSPRGEVKICTTLKNGRLVSDVFAAFVPINKTGGYIYYVQASNGKSFEFYKEDLSTTTLYKVDALKSGFVVFEDDNFKNYCVKNFDLNSDGKVSFAEAAAVKRISIYERNIGSLKGIEHFKNLTYLVYFGSQSSEKYQLTSLDISLNVLLDTLAVSYNKLKSLNISKNTKLIYLQCDHNTIKSLDVSNNTVLEKIYCQNNQLTELDLSKNTALIELSCADNQIANFFINVRECPALERIYCQNNRLTYLDFSKNTALRFLRCEGNSLHWLDVSKNTTLEYLDCENNNLDIAGLDVSKNTALEVLNCGNNSLRELDVSKNTALLELSCDTNKLSKLDVGNNTALLKLYCHSNQLTELDVSKNTALSILDCSYNELKSLDVSKNTALRYLKCYVNQFTTLDVSTCSELEALFAWAALGRLKTLIKKKRQQIYYPDPTWYGVTIIEVD